MKNDDPMLQIRAMVLCGPISEQLWKEARARNLARILAWEEVQPCPEMTDRAYNNIIADVGPVNKTWLAAQIKQEKAEIIANLRSVGLWPRKGAPDAE